MRRFVLLAAFAVAPWLAVACNLGEPNRSQFCYPDNGEICTDGGTEGGGGTGGGTGGDGGQETDAGDAGDASDASQGETCTPGRTVSCACAGLGDVGIQTCNGAGTAYGACDCGDSDAGSDAADASDQADADGGD